MGKMTRIYLKKTKDSGENSRELIRRLAWEYSGDTGLFLGDYKSFVNHNNIKVDVDGKPFFQKGFPEFSISHSGEYWCCCFSMEACGIDIQEVRRVNTEGIAERFFTLGEQKYVLKEKEAGFYDIWTRREAYGKMTGKGFFVEAPDFVNGKGELKNRVKFKGAYYNLQEIQGPMKYKWSVCSRDKNIEVIKL